MIASPVKEASSGWCRLPHTFSGPHRLELRHLFDVFLTYSPTPGRPLMCPGHEPTSLSLTDLTHMSCIDGLVTTLWWDACLHLQGRWGQYDIASSVVYSGTYTRSSRRRASSAYTPLKPRPNSAQLLVFVALHCLRYHRTDSSVSSSMECWGLLCGFSQCQHRSVEDLYLLVGE